MYPGSFVGRKKKSLFCVSQGTVWCRQRQVKNGRMMGDSDVKALSCRSLILPTSLRQCHPHGEWPWIFPSWVTEPLCLWLYRLWLWCGLASHVMKCSESCLRGSEWKRKSSYAYPHLHLLSLVGWNLWGGMSGIGLTTSFPYCLLIAVPLLPSRHHHPSYNCIPGYTWRELCLGTG